MIENSFWSELIRLISLEIPIWIIWVVGIILSIRMRRQYEKKFTLTLTAFIVFLLAAVCDDIFFAITISKLYSHSLSVDQTAFYMTIRGLTSVFFQITCWVILLIVIFNPKIDSVNSSNSSFTASPESK